MYIVADGTPAVLFLYLSYRKQDKRGKCHPRQSSQKSYPGILLARIQSNGLVQFLEGEWTEIMFLGRYVDLLSEIAEEKENGPTVTAVTATAF